MTGHRPRIERGLLECDFGDWTGASLRRLMRKREWRTIQRAPSTFRFPGGESFPEMQHRIVTTLERLRDDHRGRTIVCVSHADPIKAAVAHALGTHLDLFQRIVISTGAISVVIWTDGGPTVLAVNSTGNSLKELRLVVSVFFEFDEVDSFSATAIGEPGSRVFYLQARAGRQRITVKCEKQQVTAISQYLRRVLSDLPPPEDRPLPGAVDPGARELEEQAFVLGPIGFGYDRGNDRVLVQLEELVASDADERGGGSARGPRPHPAVRHAQPGRRVLRPRRRGGRRRPAVVHVVRLPDRPRRPPVSTDELSGSGVPEDALAILATAPITMEGRMPWASNATFLVQVEPDHGPTARAIYKPVRGERPLWDFEPGLHRREVAAFRLSETLGIGAVPPTVLRADAPLGEGSLQWFVDADHAEHYFTIAEQRPDLHDQLRGIAVLDVVANNTDRKSGHCLLARDPGGDPTQDRVWAIDNGLCFATDFKLRTVIWEFAGEALSRAQLAAVAALADCVPDSIAELISPDEVDAMQRRARWLAVHKVLPGDDSGHRYPWPLV